jgi:hypothetical protein
MKDSMLDPDYWAKNPSRAWLRQSLAPADIKEERLMASLQNSKVASADFEDSYYDDNIEVPTALRAVHMDPVLLDTNKKEIGQLLTQSSDNGRRTSGFNLTNTALRTGVSFGAAWAFGQGMGQLLSMPKPIVNRLSMAGGVAAAVVGSGILKEL